jgi:hypothetical protein
MVPTQEQLTQRLTKAGIVILSQTEWKHVDTLEIEFSIKKLSLGIKSHSDLSTYKAELYERHTNMVSDFEVSFFKGPFSRSKLNAVKNSIEGHDTLKVVVSRKNNSAHTLFEALTTVTPPHTFE